MSRDFDSHLHSKFSVFHSFVFYLPICFDNEFHRVSHNWKWTTTTTTPLQMVTNKLNIFTDASAFTVAELSSFLRHVSCEFFHFQLMSTLLLLRARVQLDPFAHSPILTLLRWDYSQTDFVSFRMKTKVWRLQSSSPLFSSDFSIHKFVLLSWKWTTKPSQSDRIINVNLSLNCFSKSKSLPMNFNFNLVTITSSTRHTSSSSILFFWQFRLLLPRLNSLCDQNSDFFLMTFCWLVPTIP